VVVRFSAIQGEGCRNLEENQKVELDVTQGPKGPPGGECAPPGVATGRLRGGPARNSSVGVQGARCGKEDPMPKEIEIDEIRPLLDAGAQLVEVLPVAEYEEEHLAGAVNIPLKQMTEEAVEGLEKDRALIVYCWDYQ
jgi:hypothetical protein